MLYWRGFTKHYVIWYVRMNCRCIPFNKINIWNELLVSIAWAICSTHHTAVQASPVRLVFFHDMIWNINFAGNWESIKQKKQLIKTMNKEYSIWVDFGSLVDNKVIITSKDIIGKLKCPTKCQFKIFQVYTNGTVYVYNIMELCLKGSIPDNTFHKLHSIVWGANYIYLINSIIIIFLGPMNVVHNLCMLTWVPQPNNKMPQSYNNWFFLRIHVTIENSS